MLCSDMFRLFSSSHWGHAGNWGRVAPSRIVFHFVKDAQTPREAFIETCQQRVSDKVKEVRDSDTPKKRHPCELNWKP